MVRTLATSSDQRSPPPSLSWFGLSRMTWHSHAFRPAKRPTSHLIADILGLTVEGRVTREEEVEEDGKDDGMGSFHGADDTNSDHLQPRSRQTAFCEHLRPPSPGSGHVSTSGGSVSLSVVGCLMNWSRVRLPPSESRDTGSGTSCVEKTFCTSSAEVSLDARTQEGKFTNNLLLFLGRLLSPITIIIIELFIVQLSKN